MDEASTKPDVIRFAEFELDLRSSQLRSSGVVVKLQPQPVRVLALLTENAGVLISREQIRQHVWGEETFVDFEQSLNFCIRQIREALDDDAKSPRFIETLPRRGYRFVAAPEKASTAPAAASPLRIGVMPFQQAGAEAKEDYFSAGLTEEMVRQLSRLAPRRMRVIARTTMMRCHQERMNLERLRQEVLLDYLLEGTIRCSAGLIRIGVELTDVKDETLVWADVYERRLIDGFGVQAEVAARVARSLALELLPGAAAPKPAPSSPAYEAYLKGRHFFNKMTADSVIETNRYFEEAIATDANYALAYAGLADCYAQMGSIRAGLTSPAAAQAKAKPMALRALELDDSLAEAHNALALIRCWYEWDWRGAAEEFDRALALDPASVTHAPWRAMFCWAIGEPDKALSEMQRAREVDPLSPVINTYLGSIHFHPGDPESSIRLLREAIRLDASYYRPYFFLGEGLWLMGRPAEALQALGQARERAPRNLKVIAFTGGVQAEMGDGHGARVALKDLLATAGPNYDPSLFAAIIHAALGEIDTALECLERAVERRFNPIYLLRLDPFHVLRNEPRFRSCLQRVGLPLPASSANGR